MPIGIGDALPNRRLARFSQAFSIRQFADGLNLLAWDRSGDYWNVTVNKLGAVEKRLGRQAYNHSTYNPQLTVNGYAWDSAGHLIVQSGNSLFLDTSTVAKHTFTTSDRVGFAEFGGSVYAIHPVDGLFSSTDGSTWSAVAGAPKGWTLAAWQNRLLAAGDPTAPTTVYACKAGDATTWTTGAGAGWTNKLDEKDTSVILRLIGTSGHDLALGDPTLIALKATSSYRIYDSAAGAYQTIDTQVGCASPLAAVALFGRVWVIHPTGIYSTDGLSAMRWESELLAPLFDPSQLNYALASLWCAGHKDDRLFFSVPRASDTTNTLCLEMLPAQRSAAPSAGFAPIIPSSDAAAWYATVRKQDESLYGGSPTVAGQVYEMRAPVGDDDGAAISSHFQTPWFEPAGGLTVEVQRARVRGRGSVNFYVRKDYENSGGDEYQVTIAEDTTATWDDTSFIWDDPGSIWGPVAVQGYEDLWGIGTCRAVSFRIEESSTVAGAAPQVFASGSAPVIGGWGLQAVDGIFTPLGDT